MANIPAATEEVIYSGVLRKKGARRNVWGERHFILKGHTLYYYLKATDIEPRGSFPLQVTTKVSAINSDSGRKRKQFTFKIIWLNVEDDDDNNIENNTLGDVGDGKNLNRGAKKRNLNKDNLVDTKNHHSAGYSAGKVAAVAVGGVVLGALTAGVGLLAGMMVVGVGAAASGGAVALQQVTSSESNNPQKERVLVLACDSYHEAEAWVDAIEGQIMELGDQVLGLPNLNRSRALHRRIRSHTPHPEVRLEYVEEWINTSRWKIYDVYEGVRLLQIVRTWEHTNSEVGGAGPHGGPLLGIAAAVACGAGAGGGSSAPATASAVSRSSAGAGGAGAPSGYSSKQADAASCTACMRVNIGIGASASDTFSSIMNFTPSMRTGIIKSIRIVQNIDNFTDIIHLKLEPIFLYPTWTAPRDFCLLRYWRDNFDGSYVICLDSTSHPECPLVHGYVRGLLNAVYLVSPPKAKVSGGGGGAHETASVIGKDNDDEEAGDCMLTFIAHMDPQGWIWRSYGFHNLFLKEFMLHVLDIRDALDADRFMQVQFDPVNETKKMSPAAAVAAAAAAADGASMPEGNVGTIPPPILARKYWMDADASTFRVRGPTYMADKVKAHSAPALFKLVAIDIFETSEAKHNISAHAANRVFLSKQRGEKSWMFVLNIMVPGTPYYNFVTYFEGDPALFEEDTPFGRIARPFFHGNDDEFRNNRFKLIPKIVDGNMMIKMAVKDTPTLLGNKLKQYYYKGDNYFEIDVDVGSSSVARNICGLAIGYSKVIVLDMGFCLQGNEENELPEVLMGCATCYHVDMTTGIKLST